MLVEVEEISQPIKSVRASLQRGLPRVEGYTALRIHHGELLGDKMILKC